MLAWGLAQCFSVWRSQISLLSSKLNMSKAGMKLIRDGTVSPHHYFLENPKVPNIDLMSFLLKDTHRKNHLISKSCHSQKRPTRMLSVLSPPCKWAKVTYPGQLHILLPFQIVLRGSAYASLWINSPHLNGWCHLLNGERHSWTCFAQVTSVNCCVHSNSNSQLWIRSQTHFVPKSPITHHLHSLN